MQRTSIPSFSALLEPKRHFLWRLDEIWGSRPNIAPVLVVTEDSMQDLEQTEEAETQQPETRLPEQTPDHNNHLDDDRRIHRPIDLGLGRLLLPVDQLPGSPSPEPSKRVKTEKSSKRGLLQGIMGGGGGHLLSLRKRIKESN